MNIYEQFELAKDSSTFINATSSWKLISDYTMFLTLKNGGCNKSTSGSLRLCFPTHWDEDFMISAEIGGYDMPNMNRHEEFFAKTEEELKTMIIVKLEEARKIILEDKELEADEKKLSEIEEMKQDLIAKMEAAGIPEKMALSPETEKRLEELRQNREVLMASIKKKIQAQMNKGF